MKQHVILFPGQGAQYVGMGQNLYQHNSAARDIFDRAQEGLDIDIKKLCFDGPQEELSMTHISQPAIFTASIAAFMALKDQEPDLAPVAMLGLSLGEYTALTAAGSLCFEDGLSLVRKRGLFMQEASEINKGKMAAVIGLDENIIEEICLATGCEIANLNAPGQIVIAGRDEAMTKANALLSEKGAKRVLSLDVSGAFHTKCMEPAREKLTREINQTKIHEPTVPVISNVDAEYERTPEKIKKNLSLQVVNKTYWQRSVEKALNEYADAEYFEVGPGKALRGFMKKINPAINVINIASGDDLQKINPPAL